MPDNGLSEQDVQDLKQIRSMLPSGDARIGKLDTLLGSSASPSTPEPAPYTQTLVPQGAQIRADNGGGVSKWLDDVEGDVRYGSTSTIPGKILAAMGARGINRGVSEGAADKIASPIVGTINAARGATEIPDHPVSGAAHVIGGALQAAELPMAFMGGPGAKQAIEAIPSKSWAGKAFAQVMSKAGSAEVDTNAAGNAALDLQKLAQSGGQMPKVARDFLKRVTDPNQGPLTYEEARNFYSNATRLSADEFNRLTPIMKRAVGQFTQTLGKSIQQTAANVGEGDTYAAAMSNFKNASTVKDTTMWLVKKGVPAGVAGLLAERLARKMMR